jgi:hypothetical protein
MGERQLLGSIEGQFQIKLSSIAKASEGPLTIEMQE